MYKRSDVRWFSSITVDDKKGRFSDIATFEGMSINGQDSSARQHDSKL